MRIGTVLAVVIAIALAVIGFYLIDIDQTQEATLPEVEVEGGQAPKFDAEVGEVDVGTKEVEVTVPTVDVKPPEEPGSGTQETPTDAAQSPANQDGEQKTNGTQ